MATDSFEKFAGDVALALDLMRDYDAGDPDEPYQAHAQTVETYASAGVLSGDRGWVVTLEDGTEVDVVIRQRRGSRR